MIAKTHSFVHINVSVVLVLYVAIMYYVYHTVKILVNLAIDNKSAKMPTFCFTSISFCINIECINFFCGKHILGSNLPLKVFYSHIFTIQYSSLIIHIIVS